MKKFLLMLLSLLGFSFVVTSCYGAPYAELTAEGRVTDETSATLRPGPAQKSWQFPAATVPSTFMRTTTSP